MVWEEKGWKCRYQRNGTTGTQCSERPEPLVSKRLKLYGLRVQSELVQSWGKTQVDLGSPLLWTSFTRISYRTQTVMETVKCVHYLDVISTHPEFMLEYGQ